MPTRTALPKLPRLPLPEACRQEAAELTLWLVEAGNLAALEDALSLSELELVIKPNDWVQSDREMAPQIRSQRPRSQHWLNNPQACRVAAWSPEASIEQLLRSAGEGLLFPPQTPARPRRITM